ncbi:MAG TPA: hypothetical protein VGB98_03700 [Pyrinomonadaceae bacterium]|jgi:hypothetical protein
MNAHSLRGISGRRNLVPLTAFFLLSVAAFFGIAASGAHPQDDGATTPAVEEREFKTEIPEHLPIRVKLKSEKSFKDLKNKKWLRELEVEVKNTGSKPIYFVQFLFDMPGVLVGGHPLVFGARYGRVELFYPETQVEPGDMPIMPGESATLKASAQNVKGYEYNRDVSREYGDPKSVVCRVSAIKFGDGTGLWGRDGKIVPPKRVSKSSTTPKQKNGAEGCRSGPAVGTMNAPSDLFKVSNSWQPASLLRAYFLPPVDAPAPAL